MNRCRVFTAMQQMVLVVAAGLASMPSLAQPVSDTAQILSEIARLRADQARIDELQKENARSLRALEARLGLPTAQANPVPVAEPPSASPSRPTTVLDQFKWTGDLRVRAQADSSDDSGSYRESMQVRARAGVVYTPSERVALGARLVTGDADDPNSSDVQLSNWDDDFEVALDFAYAQLNAGDAKLYGGKIPLPFARTDLVWDSDVNPQGMGATWKRAMANGSSFRAGALLFAVDESAAGDDSTMAGAQLGFDTAKLGAWQFDASIGYYDYSLGNVAGADVGDFRSNLRGLDGHYLSDFDLLDVLAGATWSGENPRWPLRLVADYVRNLGAASNADRGYGVDVALGRVSEPGDWRVAYGYSRAQADAVLAAFSHDNIGIATNYRLHALAIDYLLMPRTQVSALWYHYRPDDSLHSGTSGSDDWLNRLRFYLLVNF